MAMQATEKKDPRVPITVISGFLGAGKTSLLQHILQNNEGLRVGMIVNDMAAVNIDAKLVRGSPGAKGGYSADTVELQNGCVCCSMSDELFQSVDQLMKTSKRKKDKYNHIVIETTGVAEPRSIRDTFQDAAMYGMSVMNQVRLDTMVTVVDCGVFLDAYLSGDSIQERPDLGLEELPSTPVSQRAVVDLLVEQVECADIVLLNKVDSISEERLEIMKQIVRALNPKASIMPTTYGKVPYNDVLGCMKGMGVAELGMLDDHREAIEAATASCSECGSTSHTHEHHEHDHQPEHSHDHQHENKHKDNSAVAKHEHNHDHKDEACGVCGSSEEGHDHSHSHSHTESAESITATTRFGITNFVYRRRRPFHPERLMSFIKSLPTKGKLVLSELQEGTASFKDESIEQSPKENKELITALSRLVRSKGFIWLANTDVAAMYWSHAGTGFELTFLGRWWASVPKEGWPEGTENAILEDFEGKYGDRRQELVFIGLNLREKGVNEVIENALDACLLTDDELDLYEKNRQSGETLEKIFNKAMSFRF